MQFPSSITQVISPSVPPMSQDLCSLPTAWPAEPNLFHTYFRIQEKTVSRLHLQNMLLLPNIHHRKPLSPMQKHYHAVSPHALGLQKVRLQWEAPCIISCGTEPLLTFLGESRERGHSWLGEPRFKQTPLQGQVQFYYLAETSRIA